MSEPESSLVDIAASTSTHGGSGDYLFGRLKVCERLLRFEPQFRYNLDRLVAKLTAREGCAWMSGITVEDLRRHFPENSLAHRDTRAWEIELSEVLAVFVEPSHNRLWGETVEIRMVSGEERRFGGAWGERAQELNHCIQVRLCRARRDSRFPLISNEALSVKQLSGRDADWSAIKAFAYTYDPREGRCSVRICLFPEIVVRENSIPVLRSALWEFVFDTENRMRDGKCSLRDDDLQHTRKAVEKIRQALAEIATGSGVGPGDSENGHDR